MANLQDTKNMAMDKYKFDKQLLIALNSDDTKEVRRLILEDMKIIENDYEEEFVIQPDSNMEKELPIHNDQIENR